MIAAIDAFEKALLDLDKIKAKRIVDQELEQLADPLDLVANIIVPTLERIGTGWENGSLALSQIYMSGRICEQIIDEILPVSTQQRIDQPRLGIAVLNDYHLLRKRIIYSHIRSAGYELKDYGRKSVEELISIIMEDEIEIILISTLMYPSALQVKELIIELRKIAPHVKVVVGGAPFNMDGQLWQEVGADAMGTNGTDVLAYLEQVSEATT